MERSIPQTHPKSFVRIPGVARRLAIGCVVTLSGACGGGDGPTDPTPAEPPAISAFAATPAQIEWGASAALSWSTSNATTCAITGGVGNVPCTGSTNVTPGAPTTYTLTATGPGGSRTASASVGFVPPALSALTPDEGLPGQALEVTLTGAGFVTGETEVAVGGEGVTVSDVDVTGATSLGFTLTLAADAGPGERAVQVTTPAGTSSGLPFLVLPLPEPVLQQVAPATGTQGSRVTVTLSGSGFMPGATAVSVSGDGIAVENVETGAGPAPTVSVLTAEFVVAEDASPGEREVTVTTPGGTSEPAPFTVRASAPASAVVHVATGSDHTCAVLGLDGSTWCFGYGTTGALGGGVEEHSVEPVEVVGGHAFVQLSGGNLYTCGLTESGQAWCWGRNTNGRLGNGNDGDSSVPVPVSGGHTFTRIAAGHGHTCAIDNEERAWCWGTGSSGRLGNGSASSSAVPVPVAGDHAFVSIATSPVGGHSCGVRSDGVALCWGNGALGNGNTTSSLLPVAVAGDHDFASIAVGNASTCAITGDGAAWCWGNGVTGRLGTGSNASSGVPVAVAGGHTFTEIDGANNGSYCALATDQQVYCWGSGSNGKLGNGSLDNQNRPTPVSGGHAFTSISLGGSHACGRTVDGGAWCWGLGLLGRLGNGGTDTELTPVEVTAGPFGTAQPAQGG